MLFIDNEILKRVIETNLFE